MNIKNALAGVAVEKLDDAVVWYSKLIGHGPDNEPMPEVAEFKFADGGWLQIFVDKERAGKSSVTITVEDLKEQIAVLNSAAIDVGKMSTNDFVATAIVNDPNGNQIVFAQAKSAENVAAS